MNKYPSNQRRLRANAQIREIASQVTLSHKDMIQPLFIDEALKERIPNEFMTGVYQETLDSACRQIETDLSSGVDKFLIFPVPALKSDKDLKFDFAASIIQTVKQRFGSSAWLAADLCLCSYTTHGHCGLINDARDKVLNDPTVRLLANYALQLAQSGADCIAPSDMMDGRIGAIRAALDENDLDDCSIMSYSAKFSSGFYGPFRDVCKSAPSDNILLTGRSTYQMDPRNGADAIASSLRDIDEGADMIMVKPCLPYLDILAKLRRQVHTPIVVYHVSGEYAAFELLVKNGLINRDKGLIEIWTACKRAGASAIITYAARDAKKIIGAP